MPRIIESTSLADQVLARLAGQYAGRVSIPDAFLDADPLVLQKAMELADDNIFRMVVDEDGSITVYNHNVWE